MIPISMSSFLKNRIMTSTWLIRLFAICLSVRFFALLVSHFSYLFHKSHSFSYWRYATTYLIEAIVINVGLWSASTEIGKRFKYITLILLIPSIAASPFAMPKFLWPVWVILVLLAHASVVWILLKKGG